MGQGKAEGPLNDELSDALGGHFSVHVLVSCRRDPAALAVVLMIVPYFFDEVLLLFEKDGAVLEEVSQAGRLVNEGENAIAEELGNPRGGSEVGAFFSI